jgi:hypothetical protein
MCFFLDLFIFYGPHRRRWNEIGPATLIPSTMITYILEQTMIPFSNIQSAPCSYLYSFSCLEGQPQNAYVEYPRFLPSGSWEIIIFMIGPEPPVPGASSAR